MVRRFPTDPIFQKAARERNWLAFAISRSPAGKLEKHPANAWNGHSPVASEQAAMHTLESVLEAVDDLNSRKTVINAIRLEDGKPEVSSFEIGYLCRAGSALVGIDLDDCRSADTGDLAPELLELIKESNTYWESSISGTGVRMLAERLVSDEDLNGERDGLGFYSKPMRGLVVQFLPDPSSPLKIGPAHPMRRRFRKLRRRIHPVRLPILAEDQASISDVPTILVDLPNPGRGREEWIRMGMSLRVIADHSEDPALAAEIEAAWITWSKKGEAHGCSGRPDSPERAWRSFRDVREISSSTFWYLARDLGWVGRDRRVPPIFSMERSLQAASSGSEEHLRRLARSLLNDLGAGDMATDHLVKAIGRSAEIPEAVIFEILTAERARWYETTAELMTHAKETERMRKLTDAFRRGEEELNEARDELMAQRFMALARSLPPSQRPNALRWIKREWQVG